MTNSTSRDSFEKNLRGESDDEPAHYRENIIYQPSFFVSRLNGRSKVELRTNDLDALVSAPELNPDLLAEQGIQSSIDPKTNNVIYQLPNGTARFGVYDRRNAETAAQPASQRAFQDSLVQLVQAADPDFPRIPIIATQATAAAALGESFPKTFNYRSILFDEDTTYGFFVDIDKQVVGAPEEFKEVVLDDKFVIDHPYDMNFLLRPILDAARKGGLEFHDLLLSESVDARGKLGFLALLNPRYSTTVSYKRTPQIGVCARLNGIPLGLSFSQKQEKLCEISLGAMELDGSYVTLVSRGSFHNADNKDESLTAPIIYQVISRDESVAEAGRNANFGVLEIQVVRGYDIAEFSVDFKQEREARSALQNHDYESAALKSFGPTRSYTAGRSGLGQTRQGRIETVPFGFECVLFRDAYCLVHRETEAEPARYS